MGRNSVTKQRLDNPKKKLEIILDLMTYLRTNSLLDSNMDDIAAGLNRSKATLYKYFASKEEMVESLINYKIAEIAGFVLILKNDTIPYIDRYQQSFELLETHIVDISNDFIKDLRDLFPKIYAQIEQLIDLAVKELSIYYEEGMRKGIFNRLNSKLLSYNDFIFFRTITNPDFLKDNSISIHQAFKDFYDIRCMGIIKNN